MPVGNGDDALAWYAAHAAELAPRYEAVHPEELHGWLVDLLPDRPALILDVGAGTGRDAAWLASLGHEVVAVEPVAALRAEAQRRHLEPRIRWLDDRLPGLKATERLGLAFDLILLSAVWMHVAPAERPRAFRKLLGLLKPGGVLALTLRHGPAEPGRGFHPVSAAEIERSARAHGGFVERISQAEDRLSRPEVSWTQLAVRLPDDGTGALPLLRRVILADDKSSTYKLALLRVVARLADGAAGLAREAGADDEEHVAVPLGLVGLYWIRAFLPLLKAGLPQTPTNRGLDGLGFVGPGFRGLVQISPLDLRVGGRFTGELAQVLHQGLREACETVVRMPAHHMTHPDGAPVLRARRARSRAAPATLVLDAAYLWSFGELRVPRHLWRALSRFDAWIEPALVAEWARLMQVYAERQGRQLDPAAVARAMAWADPAREVAEARRRALGLLEAGRRLGCVWTGRRLDARSLDIDHCLPWSAWPCGDLWNLMPAHRQVNQRLKRDRLPSAGLLERVRAPILGWWEAAYLASPGPSLTERFFLEARASLPGLGPGEEGRSAEAVFAGVGLQRLRLKQDQQVPEWSA